MCFNLTMDTLPKACDILLDEHQFETIKQKVVDRQDFQLEFDIRNHFFPGPMKYHNILAVIKGSKYPDEYVMMGGHLDAYDIATGSTDDGQGVCVTMEAARLLAAAGAKPKRSIMFCIWTAEEYGLLGSKYFVQNKTIPWDKISNYFNRDGGPLAAVSITVPPAMYDDFSEVCEPLKDYNPDIPFEVIKREGEPQARPTSAGGSDHAYFAMNGIPAISFREQDIFGYDFIYRDIWHTEDDLYDKLIPEYLEHSAVVQAVTAYGLANLNHLLSRDGLYKD
jgi:Zn-dependent M28 family amino/carboxypeptidase